ncbi:hypothetical protein ACKP2L_05355 [Oenococcus alcoholitolerans]|uniref:hypothetical protein n=1 Tax=Oenococcus alcoholitolerans TaxID=931074 RepID=UPI003F72468C
MKDFYLLKYNGKYVSGPSVNRQFGGTTFYEEFYDFNELSFTNFGDAYKYPTHDLVLDAMKQLVDTFKLDKNNFEFEHYALVEP